MHALTCFDAWHCVLGQWGEQMFGSHICTCKQSATLKWTRLCCAPLGFLTVDSRHLLGSASTSVNMAVNPGCEPLTPLRLYLVGALEDVLPYFLGR